MDISTTLHAPSSVRSLPEFARLLRRYAAWAFAILMLMGVGVWASTANERQRYQDNNQLVRWQDARHDWLLVIEPSTRELVVYDAADGRPLRRLGADEGLPLLQSIVRQGRWLVVSGVRQPQSRRLSLPELREVASEER